MKTHKVSVIGIALAGILLMLQAPLRIVAQEPASARSGTAPAIAGARRKDPPGRVARLSYSVGSVSFQPGGEGDWVQAVTNRPLTTRRQFVG